MNVNALAHKLAELLLQEGAWLETSIDGSEIWVVKLGPETTEEVNLADKIRKLAEREEEHDGGN